MVDCSGFRVSQWCSRSIRYSTLGLSACSPRCFTLEGGGIQDQYHRVMTSHLHPVIRQHNGFDRTVGVLRSRQGIWRCSSNCIA
ncbi:hypothetical protein VTJ04DRAFT_7055 [Mycothermus thermophilus]|uniref:uncharacterized protein n=1 Tax=Humicola insolens TaxID=85995 RepID=UPI0037430D38